MFSSVVQDRVLAATKCLTFSMMHCFITITTLGTDETSRGFLRDFQSSPAKCHVSDWLCDPFGKLFNCCSVGQYQ